MMESIFRTEGQNRITGIWANPSPDEPVHDVGFLFLNAGLLHKAGPNRLHVALARHLAANGFPSVRFDVSGLGDSPARGDGLPYHDSRLQEATAVMDYMQTRGVRRFVPIGLCSGADHAFRVAVDDDRVVGSIMLDGYRYPIWRHPHSFKAWLKLITGYALYQRMLEKRENAHKISQEFVMESPDRETVEADLFHLVAREVNLYFIYTSTVSNSLAEPAQFWTMFPNAPREGIEVEYWAETDHMFTMLSQQRRLIDAVVNWADRHLLTSEPQA